MTTITELIKHLKKLPPETRVMTRGYEGGYADAELTTKLLDIVLDIERHRDKWYYGPHDTARSDELKLPTVKAICL